jgi:hypothetical protein
MHTAASNASQELPELQGPAKRNKHHHEKLVEDPNFIPLEADETVIAYDVSRDNSFVLKSRDEYFAELQGRTTDELLADLDSARKDLKEIQEQLKKVQSESAYLRKLGDINASTPRLASMHAKQLLERARKQEKSELSDLEVERSEGAVKGIRQPIGFRNEDVQIDDSKQSVETGFFQMQGDVICHCMKPCARSNVVRRYSKQGSKNEGRGYYMCSSAYNIMGSCGFFVWEDETMDRPDGEGDIRFCRCRINGFRVKAKQTKESYTFDGKIVFHSSFHCANKHQNCGHSEIEVFGAQGQSRCKHGWPSRRSSVRAAGANHGRIFETCHFGGLGACKHFAWTPDRTDESHI